MPSKKTKNTYNNCLAVNRIRTSVNLGEEKKERSKPQAVEVDLKLFSPDIPAISKNDNCDFLCYDELSHVIRDFCKKQEFRTIEYLGYQIYLRIRPLIPRHTKIWVRLIKCDPPIEFVKGGTSFTYSDLPPFSWVVPA